MNYNLSAEANHVMPMSVSRSVGCLLCNSGPDRNILTTAGWIVFFYWFSCSSKDELYWFLMVHGPFSLVPAWGSVVDFCGWAWNSQPRRHGEHVGILSIALAMNAEQQTLNTEGRNHWLTVVVVFSSLKLLWINTHSSTRWKKAADQLYVNHVLL